MPKSKYKLTKKHNFLIDKLIQIPSINEIKESKLMTLQPEDYRYNTEDIILMCIEILTKDTQMELNRLKRFNLYHINEKEKKNGILVCGWSSVFCFVGKSKKIKTNLKIILRVNT